jgi:malate dehydrogenase (oxaloacetate-decarboxylating)(NADP+)
LKQDFENLNAFRLLKDFQDAATIFNDDDIQGMAAVAVTVLIASNRLTGKTMGDHVFHFDGTGEAGTGIADLISCTVSIECNMCLTEASKRICLVDSKGLVTSKQLEHGGAVRHHKLPHAHAAISQECDTLLAAAKFSNPSGLNGVSAQPKTFNEEMCELMAANHDIRSFVH